jgi:hypothetical protein
MNIVDVLVADFRGSIMHAIPEIISLLSDRESKVRMTGADALVKLSEQGKVSKILTCMLLM